MKRATAVLAAALLFSVMMPATSQPGCVMLCGDVNNDGDIKVSDLTHLIGYLLSNLEPEPPCYEQAEWDDHELLTLSDVQYLADVLFHGVDSLLGSCPTTQPPLAPPVDPDFAVRVRTHRLAVAPGAQTIDIPVTLENPDTLRAFSLPLRFGLAGDTLSLDTVLWISGIGSYFDTGPVVLADDSGGILLTAYRLLSRGLPPGSRWIATVRMRTNRAEPVSRPLQGPAYTSFPPAHNGMNSNIPLLLRDAGQPSTHLHPDLVLECCLQRGDLNDDDQISIADLTGLIGYLFSGLMPDICPQVVDIDAGGTADIRDLTFFISYLFRDGHQPGSCL